MSKLNIKEMKIEEAKSLSLDRFDITLKRDGLFVYYKGGELISERGINRSNRFTHIVRLLRKGCFPDCMGEIYIDGGKVFDASQAKNWHRVKFMPIGTLDRYINQLNSYYITLMMRFRNLAAGWAYVEANDEEGLVLKRDDEWYKVKKLHEVKISIKRWENGKQKGTFVLENGNRISGTSLGFVDQFLELKKRCKIAMAEIEFTFITENGCYFQPRLRRIFQYENN